MKVEQVAEFVNIAGKEVLGEENLVTEDLSNIADTGDKVLSSDENVENFTKVVYDRIGRTVFVDRPMESTAPNILFDSWEYGSILQKISAKLPDAEENSTWQLEDGQEYSQDIFTKPLVVQKFYNNKRTFEVPQSVATLQLKSAFTDAVSMNAFLSMLDGVVRKSLTIKNDALITRTINNFIALTLHDYNANGTYTGLGNTRAINLLARYNANKATAQKLTVQTALESPDFWRFASLEISLWIDRLGKASTLFNIGGEVRMTPRNLLKIALLSNFSRAAEIYLESDTFHNNLVELPKENVSYVPYWQGSGTDYSFSDVSSINVVDSEGNTVTASGIIGVMWDRDALGISNFRQWTTSHFNARAEFTNLWHKADTGNFNDLNENFVVFYMA